MSSSLTTVVVSLFAIGLEVMVSVTESRRKVLSQTPKSSHSTIQAVSWPAIFASASIHKVKLFRVKIVPPDAPPY